MGIKKSMGIKQSMGIKKTPSIKTCLGVNSNRPVGMKIMQPREYWTRPQNEWTRAGKTQSRPKIERPVSKTVQSRINLSILQNPGLKQHDGILAILNAS